MGYNIREKQSENEQNRTENEVFQDGYGKFERARDRGKPQVFRGLLFALPKANENKHNRTENEVFQDGYGK